MYVRIHLSKLWRWWWSLISVCNGHLTHCLEYDGRSYFNNSILRITERFEPQPLFCCSSKEEDSIEWFFPDGTSALNDSDTENRSGHKCLGCLNCVTPPLTTGIFHCNISSTAHHTREVNLYAGIYNSTHGGESIHEDVHAQIICTFVYRQFIYQPAHLFTQFFEHQLYLNWWASH